MQANYNDSKLDRISAIEDICVIYPRMKKILDKIDTCRQGSKLAAEPKSLLLMGESGAGKSTTIKQYEKRTPKIITDEGTIIPVLNASVPPKATIKGVIHEILYSLGAPNPGKGTAVEATYRIITLLKNCKVELIILDEFQHLLQRDSKPASEAIADWIKQLINKSHTPMLLVGMPGSEKLLERFPQLARRFSQVLTLEPFSYIENKPELLGFLHVLQSQLPFKKLGNVNLSDPSCAMRIFLASGGSQAWTVTLIREASKIAVNLGSENLLNEHLSAAFDEELAQQGKLANPWLTTLGEVELAIPKNKTGKILWKNS